MTHIEKMTEYETMMTQGYQLTLEQKDDYYTAKMAYHDEAAKIAEAKAEELYALAKEIGELGDWPAINLSKMTIDTATTVFGLIAQVLETSGRAAISGAAMIELHVTLRNRLIERLSKLFADDLVEEIEQIVA